MSASRKSVIPAGQQFLPLSIARMIWKSKGKAFTVWCALTAASILIIMRWPDIYRAEAVILVDSQKIPENFVASTVQVSLQDSLSAISKQVLSSDHLLKIIDDFNLYPLNRSKKPVEELVERMRTQDLSVKLERSLSGNRSGAFRISYEGPNPVVAAGVVNRVTDLFVKENVKTRGQRAQGTSEFIETQLAQAKKNLEEQEANLSKYKLQWAGELPQQEGALMGTLSMLQAELQGNQDSLNRAEQNKQMLENSLSFAETALQSASRALTPPTSGETTAVITSPIATAPEPPLQSEILEGQLQSARRRYFDDYPEVKRLTLELEQVRQAESRAPSTHRQPMQVDQKAPSVVSRPAPVSPQLLADFTREKERVFNLKSQLEGIKRELEVRNNDRRRILGEIASHQTRVGKLPIREQQMASLTRDYEISKLSYRSLHDKKLSAEISAEMEKSEQSERFTIAEPARIPVKPSAPNRLLYGLVASLGSLISSLVLCLSLELKRHTFLGEWELPSQIPVLGRIPKITSSQGRLPKARFLGLGIGTGIPLLLLTLYAIGFLASHWARVMV